MMIRYSRLLALLLHYCTHDSMLLVTFFLLMIVTSALFYCSDGLAGEGGVGLQNTRMEWEDSGLRKNEL